MNVFSGEVHPLAAKCRIISDDEMAELAASITENGLKQPLTLDWLGRLADGRNRLRACELAGVEPRFVTDPELTDDKAVARFVRAQNVNRRHMSKGEQAAVDALCLAAEGKRRNGRWVRGSITQVSGDMAPELHRMAGFILDWAPDELDKVAAGTLAIEAAYQQAKAVEDEAKREDRARELHEAQLADLRKHRPDLADLVDAASLPLADALIVRDKERADELKRQRDVEERRRKFTVDLQGAVNYLAPLSRYPERTAQIAEDFDRRHLLALPFDLPTIAAARAALDLIADMIEMETAA